MASGRQLHNPDRKLIEALTNAFSMVADRERAIQQQAYMKSAMPYYGIAAPVLRNISRELFKGHPIDQAAVWEATILDLWRNARFREERYGAIELLSFKPYRQYFSPELMPLLEEFIVSGAWWDYVDNIAINMVGPLLRGFPRQLAPLLRDWSVDDDIWRRRTAILAQLKFKGDTDTDLLFAFIEPSISEKEFFLRKAIGWALREYSKTDPSTVIDYIDANSSRLSGLTKREGLKILIKQGVLKKDDVRFG